ncbi:16S rRNA (guanine(966)-N(2))-methyltransferase RsmD [Seohaeicola zhoushanensis]|uniref:Methyltransferase n=1 Tax=Seohaeicola zhoushanensis TaxID=1569283 RepID=A0A8J3M3G6_9RHOB|nr:16S rRNA (guanine(966)-N(2))-methyltransferase RsmD [Seohaeicola zhoushanensis]GHF34507.1 methyltransferase [Seohaeicola zhoushanensis]
MRIIAGEFRGRALASVGKGDAAAHLRPTADRVRESLFSVLTHLDVIEGAQVLDLFAGTGALGLEALSRGAAKATFVDSGRVAQGLIAKNIALTGTAARASLLKREAARIGPNPGLPCTLVFLDPPYGLDMGGPALQAAAREGWIAPGALIVWEEKSAQHAPESYDLQDARRYGDTWVTLLWKVDA